MTTKPSRKAPDPMDVTREEYAQIDDLSDDEIEVRLSQRNVHPFIIRDLIEGRETAGGKWRIAQELFR